MGKDGPRAKGLRGFCVLQSDGHRVGECVIAWFRSSAVPHRWGIAGPACHTLCSQRCFYARHSDGGGRAVVATAAHARLPAAARDYYMRRWVQWPTRALSGSACDLPVMMMPKCYACHTCIYVRRGRDFIDRCYLCAWLAQDDANVSWDRFPLETQRHTCHPRHGYECVLTAHRIVLRSLHWLHQRCIEGVRSNAMADWLRLRRVTVSELHRLCDVPTPRHLLPC